MKKTKGIIIVLAILAAVAALLVHNKSKMKAEAATSTESDRAVVVRSITAGIETLSSTFTSNGPVSAVKELNFVSDISGRVVEVLVDKGSRVGKGTPLLKLDSQLYEADYKAAQAAYDAMCKDEQRFTRSNQAGGVTAQQLDNIRTQLVSAESRLARSRKMYEDCTIKSPMSGTINFRYVEAGSLIAPNVPLFDIVDQSRLKVICNLSEPKMRLIGNGQKVVLTSSTLPGKTFYGTIRNIGLKNDRGLNYPVEIILDGDKDLQIGMYLKAEFTSESEHQGILIPRKAVVGSAKSADVYVIVDGRASIRPVTLGDMFGDKVEVLSGVNEGDEIIVAGVMNVADGSAVKVVNE